VPHSECSGDDLYLQYKELRDSVALDRNELLVIDANGTQRCRQFGMHPNLMAMHRLYESGDLLWFANVGSLVEPVSADTLDSRPTPQNNFAHNVMTEWLEKVHTNSRTANGILGRLADALSQQRDRYTTGAYSLRRESKIQDNVPGRSSPPDFVNPWYIHTINKWVFLDGEGIVDAIHNMTKSRSTSIYGDYWSSTIRNGVNRTVLLRSAVEATPLITDGDGEHWKRNSYLEFQLKQAARLMGGREILGTNRNTISCAMPGFDAHNSIQQNLNIPLDDLDGALESFVSEMKAQGWWDEVVVVVASEFGRALESNGQGTDHGWGGNYMVLGGSVKGGRVLGEYPDISNEGSPHLMPGGRVVPTTSWEAIWNGIAQWMGVTDDAQLDEILPLRKNFFPDLFTKEELFESFE